MHCTCSENLNLLVRTWSRPEVMTYRLKRNFFFMKKSPSSIDYRLQDWVNSKKVLTSRLLWIYKSWMNIFIIRCFRKNNNWKICCPIGGANLLITDRQGNRDVNTLELPLVATCCKSRYIAILYSWTTSLLWLKSCRVQLVVGYDNLLYFPTTRLQLHYSKKL